MPAIPSCSPPVPRRPFPHFLRSDAGVGGAMFLLAFRAQALGEASSLPLRHLLASVFRQEADLVAETIGALSVSLAQGAQRRISLGAAGCGAVSHDEVTLLCALAAEEPSEQRAYLTWLRGRTPSSDAQEQLAFIQGAFSIRELMVRIPPQTKTVPYAATGPCLAPVAEPPPRAVSLMSS